MFLSHVLRGLAVIANSMSKETGVPKEKLSSSYALGFYEKEALHAERYSSPSFWDSRYHTERMKLVTSILNLVLRGDRFLDAGCGTGEYLSLATELGTEAVGIDISMNYLERTGIMCKKALLAQADVRKLPFRDCCFEITLCSEVIEHLSSVDSALAELFRVTRRVVIITTPNYGLIRTALASLSEDYLKRLDKSVGHIKIFSIDKLCEKLKKEDWSVIFAETFHIIPPLIGENLHMPRSLAPLVNVIEHMLNTLLFNLGNVSLIVCERVAQVEI